MTVATKNGRRGRYTRLPSVEHLEQRSLLSASGASLDDPGGQNLQAVVLPPIAATWIPQGPAPIQNGQVEYISPNNEVVGAIHTVAADPFDADILYVGGTNGGIWKTNNAGAASPTWTPQTDGMGSMSIGALEFDPTDFSYNTLVAGIGRFSSFFRSGGARTGILVTTNGGATWTNPGSSGLAGENISGVAARGSDIVVAANGFGGFGGLFRSTDGGANFVSITDGLPGSSPDVFDLVVDPTNPLRLYAPVRSAGIYRSDDFGVSWNKISSGDVDDMTLDEIIMMPSNNNTELAVASNGRLFALVMLNGQANYIGYTDDPTAAVPVWTAMDLPQTPESDGEIEGLNPREKPGAQGAIHASIRVDPSDPDIIYVGGDRQDGPFPNFLGANDFTGRLFRGNTAVDPTGDVPSPQWKNLTHSNAIEEIPGGGTASGSAPHADSREMVFDAKGDLIEVDDGGIYRRTNPGSNLGDWFSINGNLQITELHDIAYDSNSNVIIGGAQDTGTPVQLFPGSTVWTSVSTADGGDVLVDDTSTPGFSTRYSSFQNLGAFVRITFDANNVPVQGGPVGLQELSFNQLVPQFVTPLALNEANPSRLIIGGSNSVWESFDQGDTIDVIGPGIRVNSGNGNPIAYGGFLNSVPNPEVLYVGSNDNVLIRTTAGAPLLPSFSYPGGFVLDIELDDNDWRTAYVTDASDEIFFTTNAGASWTNITTDLGTVTTGFRSLEFVPGLFNDAIVVGTNLGVFTSRTSELGTWTQLGPNLPHAPVWDLDYDAADDVLVAGTLGRGAWLLNNVTTTINPFDLPDLAGDLFNVVPTQVLAGQSVDVDYRIQNADLGDAAPFRVDFFLSRDPTITTGDFLLDVENLPVLNGGSTTSLPTKSLQLPPPTDSFWNGDGTYYIGMIVDRFDFILESNEANNSNVGELIDLESFLVAIPDTQPDLLGISFNVLQEPQVGGNSIDVEFTIRNDATIDAGAFTVGFYLSRNASISTSDTLLGQFSLAALPGQTPVANAISLQLPSDEIFYENVSNEYFIGIIIDSQNTIVESDEANNRNLGELIDRDGLVITLPPSVVALAPPDTIGAFNPSTSTFFLRNSNDSGVADIAPFNLVDGPNAIPFTGDWNGDGVDTAGLYNPDTGQFRLINENANGAEVDIIFDFGLPGAIPIAGDWNGDGVDSVGFFDPNTASFQLRNSNAGGIVSVTEFNYGLPGWLPIAGDWDGNGTDTIGLYNPATATFFLRNSNDSGVADAPAFNYGLPNWVPFVGDWNSNGIDTVGVYNAATATSFLRNTNDSGVADIPAFNYGLPNWVPLAGKWTGTAQPLLAAGGASSVASTVPALTTSDVQAVLSEAVGKWAAAGFDALSSLSSTEIVIADLPDATLGLAVGNRVYLDIDAAGYGWFVDLTPQDDEEYERIATQGLVANTGPAADRFDLLTVLSHELGHVLGLADQGGDQDDIMFKELSPGDRRLPSAAGVDALMSEGAE